MTIEAVAIGAVAAVVATLAGYLMGIARGRGSRDTLARSEALLKDRVGAMEHQLAQSGVPAAETDHLRQRLEQLASPLAKQEDQLLHLHSSLRALSSKIDQHDQAKLNLDQAVTDQLRTLNDSVQKNQNLRAEIEDLLDPVMAQSGRQRALESKVHDLLSPLEQQRDMRGKLSAISTKGTRADLPTVLREISEATGVSTVVLSDSSGLPLATSEGTQHDADVRAGAGCLLFALADRMHEGGLPRPLSVMVHDSENQATVHRFLEAEGVPYLLTAVLRSKEVPADVLDPALDAVRALMSRVAWTEAG